MVDLELFVLLLNIVSGLSIAILLVIIILEACGCCTKTIHLTQCPRCNTPHDAGVTCPNCGIRSPTLRLIVQDPHTDDVDPGAVSEL